MRLRSITKHVNDQNWFAVAIDFFIVVAGVFLGIQIGNWNEARGDKAAYSQALERLSIETTTNLAALDTLDPNVAQSLQTFRHAFDALQSCTESAENQQAVADGLVKIMGTYGLHLRRNALEDLTTNPRLLAQQSVLERKRFTDMLFFFDLVHGEASYAEALPLEGRMQDNPIISIGGWEDRTAKYFGADYSASRRRLVLNVPIDEACRNNQLIKTFYTWERWQSVIPMLSRQIRTELDTTQAHLQARKK
ncbi:MAG: hypothetical protein COA69_03815 [Robiginitomaculum sp.]|nr:MAG: hypothetical protein COA69_03815 [Robiginitomaculum sp.]